MEEWQIAVLGGLIGATFGLVYDLNKKVSKIYEYMRREGKVD